MALLPRTDAHPIDTPSLSRVILELHRAGREAAFSSFQPLVLELVRQIVPFDSAWWGNAAADPMEIHNLQLHNCDASIVEVYTPWMEQDFFRAALIAQPGTSINMADLTTRAQYIRSALYRAVGKRYRIEWSLGTLLVEPVSLLYEFLTLWRHDGEKPFTETERQTKELLMPHLAEAHSAARLREVFDSGQSRVSRWAVADERGFLRDASPGFIHELRGHWPAWQGSRLPEAILQNVRLATPYNTAQLKLQITRKGAFRFLQMLPATALDSLSTREMEVVSRYGQGDTYAGIAAALGLSPATVRNHIAHAYRKLAVNNKAELAARMLAARPRF